MLRNITKTAAQRWGEHRHAELFLRGPRQKRKAVPTLEQFASRFIDQHARANRQKPGGIAHKETIIRVHLFPRWGGKRLDAITTEDVQQLKHHLRHSAEKTVNNVLTVLNTLLRKAVEWKVIDSVPCTIRLLKVPEHSLDFYDFDDYERMVEAAAKSSPNAHLIVLLGGDAGLRGGEMRALEWRDVNLKERQLRIERNDWRGEVSSTKGNRIRYVPLTQRLASALQQHQHLRSARVLCGADGRPMTEHHLKDLLARIGRRGNVRANGPHILRHTFCSHLAMRGAPARAIQELAGHRNLTTTQRYMHLSPHAVSDAIRLLEAKHARSGDMAEATNNDSVSN